MALGPCLFWICWLLKAKNAQLVTVSTEAVRMAKSRPRKDQSERSDLPWHVIMKYIYSKPVYTNTNSLYFSPYGLFSTNWKNLTKNSKCTGFTWQSKRDWKLLLKFCMLWTLPVLGLKMISSPYCTLSRECVYIFVLMCARWHKV